MGKYNFSAFEKLTDEKLEGIASLLETIDTSKMAIYYRGKHRLSPRSSLTIHGLWCKIINILGDRKEGVKIITGCGEEHHVKPTQTVEKIILDGVQIYPAQPMELSIEFHPELERWLKKELLEKDNHVWHKDGAIGTGPITNVFVGDMKTSIGTPHNIKTKISSLLMKHGKNNLEVMMKIWLAMHGRKVEF